MFVMKTSSLLFVFLSFAVLDLLRIEYFSLSVSSRMCVCICELFSTCDSSKMHGKEEEEEEIS